MMPVINTFQYSKSKIIQNSPFLKVVSYELYFAYCPMQQHNALGFFKEEAEALRYF